MGRGKIGSETFGTNVMTAEECLLFAKAAKKNGLSNEQILKDMTLIDDLLSLQRTQFLSKAIRYTKSGNLRKNLHLGADIERRIEFEINNEINDYD